MNIWDIERIWLHYRFSEPESEQWLSFLQVPYWFDACDPEQRENSETQKAYFEKNWKECWARPSPVVGFQTIYIFYGN